MCDVCVFLMCAISDDVENAKKLSKNLPIHVSIFDCVCSCCYCLVLWDPDSNFYREFLDVVISCAAY